MKRNYLKILLPAIIVLFATIAFGQNETPVRWSIERNTETAVKAGDKFNVEVAAIIDDTWHLYSLDQPPGGPLATRLSVIQDKTFELAGDIESPPAETVFDPNFNMPVRFYEKHVTFILPIIVSADATAGKSNLTVGVFYQTCNKQTCLPPKSVKLILDTEVEASQ